MTGTLVLDCEAVQALQDPHHPKHGRATDVLAANAIRGRRSAPTALRVVVPVAVRIEAGWDRTAPMSSTINRLTQALDVPCRDTDANRAVRLRTSLPQLSVVDATIGAVVATASTPVRILSSDADDMRRLLGNFGVPGSVVVI